MNDALQYSVTKQQMAVDTTSINKARRVARLRRMPSGMKRKRVVTSDMVTGVVVEWRVPYSERADDLVRTAKRRSERLL